MNDAHLHLVLNHFPIILPVIGLIVLAGGYFFKSTPVRLTALFIFVLGGISTLPAFFTGEGAEEIAEKLPGVTDAIIHRHEEFAETFAILSYILGAFSLIGLWANYKYKSYASIINGIVIIIALATLYYGKQTGTSGGEIRHTEIRSDYNATTQSNPEMTPTTEENDDD
ncbi:MAG: hypothetical protein IPM42_01405 [Saprospiraceae bacterium]|nr:hypothetical protein [Saprospiraceae bacterium]